MWFKLASATFTTHLGKMSELSNTVRVNLTASGFTVAGDALSFSKTDSNQSRTYTLTLKSNYEIENAVTVSVDSGNATAVVSGGTGGVYTLVVTAATAPTSEVKVTVSGAVYVGTDIPDVPTPDPDTTNYTITYKYMSGSTSIKTQTTEQVPAGTTKTFSTSGAPAIDGYTVSSVSPSGQQTINSNITVTYNYTANAAGGTVIQDFADQIKLNTSYNTGSQAEGTKFTTANPNTVENNATLRVQVSSSNTYELRGVGNGYAYRLYSILDDTDTVLTRANAMDTRTEPYVFNPPENADEIIINFIGYDASKDSFKQISQ